ncbi:MAG: aminodeoxychorismate synthase component I [Pseudomonadota bacterium]
MTLFAFSMDDDDPVEIFTRFRDDPYSLFLDSADRDHPSARYSFIACQPFETIESKAGQITVINRDERLSFHGDPFSVLKERLAKRNMNVPHRDDLPPFQGGAAGFFGYDLAQGIEKLPVLPSASEAPDMAVGLYDQVASFDHQKGEAWYVVLAADEKTAEAGYRRFLHQVDAKGGGFVASSFQPEWSSSFTRQGYEQAVRRVRDYIHAGDIFQANLSQRFEATIPPEFDSFAHYCHLRQVNAAPFAAYMNFGGLQLSSASPERFLCVQGGRVETRPIKGTRPRLSDPRKDEEMRQELLLSGKDRAENVMIVDLLRNDLSKVCGDFSVDVPQLCAPESFAAVHHLVSTVTGTLRAGQTPVDLLRACFPGGSVTGAPKVRSMEIIAEMEGVTRGPYCGAMGYIGFSGAMDTNIVIRTLVYEGDRVRFNTGGGITADSVPAAEYQETLDKAAAIFGSFT